MYVPERHPIPNQIIVLKTKTMSDVRGGYRGGGDFVLVAPPRGLEGENRMGQL